MPGFSDQWLDCVQPATPWGWNPLASRLGGGFLGHTGSLWAQLKPWQGLVGPQGCQRRLPRGNIGAVVPNVLLHFKVKMWSTHWTGKWPWHYKCTELKNNNHYNLRTPVPPHFLLFSPRLTYLRRGGGGAESQLLASVINSGQRRQKSVFSSVAQLCPTLCDTMDCSTPDLPVHHQLPEFTQTHVHRVGDAIQPSHPLSSPSPPAFNISQHQGLFRVSSSHQVAKGLEFQLQPSVLPMNTQDWSLLGWTCWISLQSKGLSRVFSNTTLQKHQFFGAQLSSQLSSNSHIHTWPLEKP